MRRPGLTRRMSIRTSSSLRSSVWVPLIPSLKTRQAIKPTSKSIERGRRNKGEEWAQTCLRNGPRIRTCLPRSRGLLIEGSGFSSALRGTDLSSPWHQQLSLKILDIHTLQNSQVFLGKAPTSLPYQTWSMSRKPRSECRPFTTIGVPSVSKSPVQQRSHLNWKLETL